MGSSMRKQQITAERLRQLVRYDQETGHFIRNIKTAPRAIVDRPTGADHNGYLAMSLDCRRYYLHRLAWLYMVGEWPRNKIDHIDGNRKNNVWANLRDVSDMVSAQNMRRASKNNAVGLLGVYKKRKRFVARIYTSGKQIVVGSFDSPEEAHAAYVTAKRRHHIGCTI